MKNSIRGIEWTKAATPPFTPRTLSASLSTIRLYTETVGPGASDLDTIMHGVAYSGSVRASQWLRREHAAYMATPLLALDASLSQNINKRTLETSLIRVQSPRGLGFILSKSD